MIKTLLTTLKQDKETFEVPKSVQDAIPIRRLWPDGIFQFGNKFSKTLRFSDINYAIASKEDKTAMFLDYSELLNALDAGSTTKITINNKRVNREDFEREILLPRQDDALDGYRAEYNAMLMDKVTDSSNSVAQERYITLSVHRKSVEEARTFFDRVVHDVTSRLNHLDSHSEELDTVERLRVLHDFYRAGEETEYRLDLRECMRRGHSFKDAVCPDSLEFKKDHFVMGNKYGRVLFLKEYASYIKDSMINELTGKVTADMDKLTIPQALVEIFAVIQRANKYIDETAPWALAKDEANKPRLESVLYHLCEALRVSGILLNAYLPSTAPKMMDQLGLDASALDLAKTVYGAQETYTVHKGDALFPRIDVAKEIAHLKEEDEKRKAAAEAANKAKAEAEKKAAAPAEENGVDFTHEEEIDFDTFCKVELRVAEVRACENLKESKKLLHLTVFDGERERCILSGIAKWFKPEDLIGKKIGIVCNLAPRPMMKGKYVSEGMIFAADTADGGCSIAFYGDDTPVGSRIH